ncbi:TPA: polysaccharide lyase 8 family protein [Vibrio vulnificus]|nr:polysaccharide lyase 8 family protein [Vibrio vulnificus]
MTRIMHSQHLMQIRSKLSQSIVDLQGAMLHKCDWHQTIAQYQSAFSHQTGWLDAPLTDAEQDGERIFAYLQRVLLLACQHYQRPCASILETIEQALAHWYRHNPTHWNWWWNQIGKQRLLGPIALLISDALSPALQQKLMDDLPAQASMTGANKADLANGVAYRALLENNQTRFAQAMAAIADTIVLTQEEGIQADFSYQQHGPQLQNGGYGESFLNVALPWVYAAADTCFRFSSDQQRLLLSYFLQGSMWMTRTGRWDYNVCGRAIAKPDLEKPHSRASLKAQATMLMALFPQHRLPLESYLAHLDGRAYPFAGFKHFWRSDYSAMVNHRFSVTVKTNSRRTKPIETGNQENLLGFWLGFGSMNISVTGDEYHDIYPYWDWAKIPGVTSPSVAMPAHEWGRIEQNTEWTGGVSNGRWGIASFELDVQQTQGLKSWFFCGDAIVALGAGIRSEHQSPIVTAINQCHAQTPVAHQNENGVERCDAVAVQGWLHHANVGYLLGEGKAYLRCDEQQGSWQKINAHLSDEEVAGKVFSLWIEHGVQPHDAGYHYTLLPGATLAKTQQYAAQPEAQVLHNLPQLQAVQFRHEVGCVFRQAGRLELTSFTHQPAFALEVDKPCLLLCERTSVGFRLALSTPGRADKVQITLHQGGQAFAVTIETSALPDKLGESVLVDIEAEPSMARDS